MKTIIRKRIINAYERRIREAKSKGQVQDLNIEVSQKCSSYDLTWDEFLLLKKKLQRKALDFGYVMH